MPALGIKAAVFQVIVPTLVLSLGFFLETYQRLPAVFIKAIPAAINLLPGTHLLLPAFAVKHICLAINRLTTGQGNTAVGCIVGITAVPQPAHMHGTVRFHIAGISVYFTPARIQQAAVFKVIEGILHTVFGTVLPAQLLGSSSFVQVIPPAIDLLPALVAVTAVSQIVPAIGGFFPAGGELTAGFHITQAAVHFMPALGIKAAVFQVIVPTLVLSLGFFLEAYQLFSAGFIKAIPAAFDLLPRRYALCLYVFLYRRGLLCLRLRGRFHRCGVRLHRLLFLCILLLRQFFLYGRRRTRLTFRHAFGFKRFVRRRSFLHLFCRLRL